MRQIPKHEPERGPAGPKGTAVIPGSPGFTSLPGGSCEFKLLLITWNQVSQFCNQHEWMRDLGFSLTRIAIKQLRNVTSIIFISFLQGYAGLPGHHGQKVLTETVSHEASL